MPESMYDELAAWWPLLSAPEDYAEEAGFYTDILRQECQPATVLELGSGGGNNATHMKRHFKLTLADLSPAMLEVSRALNPRCDHVLGDMRDMRLGREFDAVFIHDAVMYMATRSDLLRALETAAIHCRPGGAVLIAPDCTAETWAPGTAHGGHDGEGRALRYLEWTHDDDPDDEQDEVDFVFVLREDGKPTRIVHERHIYGVFAENTWIELCRRAGLHARKAVVTHTGVGDAPVFICRKI